MLEWMKVRRYRTFWVLFTLFLVSMFGISFIWWYFNYQLSQGDIGMKMVGNMIFGSFNFPGLIGGCAPFHTDIRCQGAQFAAHYEVSFCSEAECFRVRR